MDDVRRGRAQQPADVDVALDDLRGVPEPRGVVPRLVVGDAVVGRQHLHDRRRGDARARRRRDAAARRQAGAARRHRAVHAGRGRAPRCRPRSPSSSRAGWCRRSARRSSCPAAPRSSSARSRCRTGGWPSRRGRRSGRSARRAGPSLGGLVIDVGNWRWAFWLNLPLGLAALVVGAACARPDAGRSAASRCPTPSAGSRCSPGWAALVLGPRAEPVVGVGRRPHDRLPRRRRRAARARRAAVASRTRARCCSSTCCAIAASASATWRMLVLSVSFFGFLFTSVLFLTDVWDHSIRAAGPADRADLRGDGRHVGGRPGGSATGSAIAGRPWPAGCCGASAPSGSRSGSAGRRDTAAVARGDRRDRARARGCCGARCSPSPSASCPPTTSPPARA